MLRVGFLIQDMCYLGGTERSACNVMNGLADVADIFLIEICPNGASAFDLDPKIKSLSLFEKPRTLIGCYLHYIKRLSALLKLNKIDVLIVVESKHALYAPFSARLAGVRCIVWEHFNFNVTLGNKKRKIARYIAARYAHDIVVLTQRDKEIWQDKTKLAANIVCIPNSVPDICSVHYNSSSTIVSAIGRLTHQKGFDQLLASWSLVQKDPDAKHWTLQIVGKGPEASNLQAISSSIPNVKFIAPSKDITEIYQNTGIFALSSRYEGLPMVLLEATSIGVPIVAFDCETGPQEVIHNNENGFLVPVDDTDSFAQSLLQLMKNPSQRINFSINAKKMSVKFCRITILNKWKTLLGI